MQMLALCALALLFTVGVYAVWSGSRLTDFVFSPLGVFLVFYSLVYFVVPVVQYVTGMGRFGYYAHASVSRSAAWQSVFYCLLYLLSALVACAFSHRTVRLSQLRSAVLASSPRFSKLALWALGAVLCTSASLTLYLFGSLMIQNYGLLIGNRISVFAGFGYVVKPMLVSVPMLIILITLYYQRRAQMQRRGVLLLAAFAIAIVSVGIQLVLASRSSALLNLAYPAIPAGMLLVGRVRPRHFAFTAIAVTVVLVALSALGTMRRMLVSEGASSFTDFGAVAVSSPDETVREVYTSLGQAELLAYLIDHRAAWDLAGGKTYLAAAVLPIPRAFWGDKPVGGGPYLKNIVQPGSYDLAQMFNTSYTTGGPLEAYMNFGLAGVLLVGLVHGLGVGFTSRLGTRVRNSYQFTIYVLLLFAVGEEFVYGEFLMVIGRIGTMVIPVFVVAYAIRLTGLSPRRRSVVLIERAAH